MLPSSKFKSEQVHIWDGFLPPAWKIKRELLRIRDQITLPIMQVTMPPMVWAYDLTKAVRFKKTKGRTVQGTKVALLLLFQPAGVAESTFETCKCLIENGFSIFITSNAPLSEGDRNRLSAYCFEILERPNFGYDFGGYRDGILHLLDRGQPIDRLFVLNDSCWFPVQPAQDFLDRISTTNADMIGAVSNFRSNRKNDHHLQSYAFGFGPKLLRHPAFRQFWQNLTVSNNRHWTVERCEVAMSPWFAARGFNIEPCWSHKDLDNLLHTATIAELEEFIHLEATNNPGVAEIFQAILDQKPHDAAWANHARDALIEGPARRYVLLAHPILLRKLGFPFLKKNSEIYYARHRQMFLKQGSQDLSSTVHREIAMRDGPKSASIFARPQEVKSSA